MSTRPRVTATYCLDAYSLERAGVGTVRTSPGVSIDLSFDLHDHEAAQKALDCAVADVRAQIEETR
ncbi:hypothetical protein EEW87_004320 [Janibacter melonis]|uniref:Uncharacterized protein n=1 Tax=Janibacter melonis TaxID=262209 RepID=A0A5P8FLC2_9MICO|nr:hypothetical protein [Janibacter melonis]QFQ29724.2 hypothetical protein EEW87_004320 [Janibacter melonis]